MAYTVTVTSPMKKAERISRSLGIYAGKCDISAYATADLAEITAITKFFVDVAHTGAVNVKMAKGVLSCIANGPSDNGHIFEWNATGGYFECFKPSGVPVASGSTTITIGTSAGGVAVLWDSANNRFQCTTNSGTITTTIVGTTSAAVVATQMAGDAGEITFTAIGFIR
jgi:hypothetical protein